MTPAGRHAAAIELLEAILPTLRERQTTPADAIVARYFKQRRYIGAKDRGDIARNVYYIIRHLASLTWRLEQVRLPVGARNLLLVMLVVDRNQPADEIAGLWSGDTYGPSHLHENDRALLTSLTKSFAARKNMPPYAGNDVQEWIYPLLEERFGEEIGDALAALNSEAPIDIRVNSLKTTRNALMETLTAEGFLTASCPLSPLGIRIAQRGMLFATKAFRAGHFEMQDEGSQLVALMGQAKPGEKVIDFCAGAGGKTLALAAEMKNKGRLLALDVAEHRMADTKKRVVRAGVDNTQIHLIASESDPWLKRHKASADLVLVDAPCTGTGTWRRNPDLKWRVSPESLADLVAVQARILENAAKLVKPGGRLVYATCSVLRNENEQQVSALLQKNHDFRVVPVASIWDNPSLAGKTPFLQLSPHQDGTDGFFAAALVRETET